MHFLADYPAFGYLVRGHAGEAEGTTYALKHVQYQLPGR